MTPEGKVQDAVEVAASSFQSRLLRNNSGVMMNPEGVPVRFGLGNTSKKVNDSLKSSDLIGWTTVEITPEMVGRKVAIFTAIEVKPESFKIKPQYREGTREHAQEKFCNLVRNAGGFGAIVNSHGHYDATMLYFIESLKVRK